MSMFARLHRHIVFPDQDTVPGNGSNTYEVKAKGAEKLQGAVRLPNNQYDVVIQYFDPSFNTKVREKTLASNVAGGTWTELSDDDNADFVRLYSPFFKIKLVNDASGDEQPEGIAYAL